jgi:hypothetical protein
MNINLELSIQNLDHMLLNSIAVEETFGENFLFGKIYLFLNIDDLFYHITGVVRV